MQKKTILLFHLILALFFTFTTNGCISYKPVQVKEIKSVQPLNDDISTGKLVVSLRVLNPNNYPIKIKKYDLHGYINDNDLGQVEVGEKVVLRKRSDEDYKITLAPDVDKIMTILPGIVFKGSGDIALKGSVKIKALFMSKKFDVDLKKRVTARDFK